jgi:hypothetical protein
VGAPSRRSVACDCDPFLACMQLEGVPEDPSAELNTFGTEGFRKDREGISIYRPRGKDGDAGAGLILVSDQGRRGCAAASTQPRPHAGMHVHAGMCMHADCRHTRAPPCAAVVPPQVVVRRLPSSSLDRARCVCCGCCCGCCCCCYSEFRAYCRQPPHQFVHSLRLGGVEGSDGSEVTAHSLGPGLEGGAFVAMTEGQFMIYSWNSIEPCLEATMESTCSFALPYETGAVAPSEGWFSETLAVLVLVGLATSSLAFVIKKVFKDKVLKLQGLEKILYANFSSNPAGRQHAAAAKSSLEMLAASMASTEDEENQPLVADGS